MQSIFEVYLKTIEEVDSEELVQSLSDFMLIFQDDIAPYTVQLATNLTSQYQRLIQVGFEADEGESTLAAVGCVQAICRIVEAAKNDQANLQQLQAIVYSILMHGLTPEGMDVVEDCLSCINMLIYYGTP